MRNLTEKEILFINELKNDYRLRGKQSFLHSMFLSGIKNEKELMNDLCQLFNGQDYRNFFQNSDLIIESIQSCYIGKYQEHFWGTDSEGSIFGLGKEIQNIPYTLICSEIGDLEDEESKSEVIQHFNKFFGVDYYKQIEDYKKFCEKFGFNYIENYEYIQNQINEFNELINNLGI